MGNTGLAGAGEIIHDTLDNWVIGFSSHISIATSIRAELWAVQEGLKLAWRQGFRHIIVEMDSHETLNLISTDTDQFHYHLSLLSDNND